MKCFEVEKLYFKTDAPDVVSDIMANITRDMPDDLRACMIAGCQIDTTIENGIMKIKTRYPVSILKDPQGKPIHVLENRGKLSPPAL